jgi:membrane protein implicated in regulation of membrane protease activity
MTPTTFWIILATILAGAEMFTATFYLLVLALGAGAGALAGYFALSIEYQIVIATAVSAAGFVILRTLRPPTTASENAANPDLNIDIGSVVRIADVLADGTLRVSFRGSMWTARLATPGTPQTNIDYKIIKIDGNVLILHPIT